ncbi:jg11889 [Pararge aegeria aegeria]|uniref:Jg11889 protein n=1 Tax=Pararge aegeria aegeria TaxID=348720 RepID=A0A8S4SN55_9NEOP|nr:jg11889 [Pararge aegeria aegeria]
MGGAHRSKNQWTLGFQGAGMATPHRGIRVKHIEMQAQAYQPPSAALLSAESNTSSQSTQSALTKGIH